MTVPIRINKRWLFLVIVLLSVALVLRPALNLAAEKSTQIHQLSAESEEAEDCC